MAKELVVIEAVIRLVVTVVDEVFMKGVANPVAALLLLTTLKPL